MPVDRSDGLARSVLLGIDTGGTFTDFVVFDGTALRVHKRLSTPSAPEQAILAGITALITERDTLHITHGSTVATNAVLEHKGARVAYIGNRGLADLLTIGRQARRELYNLRPRPTSPPVPRELCFEVSSRLDAHGAVIETPSEDELAALVRQISAARPEAIAINLLFSFIDDRHERALADRFPASMFVSRSSTVLPEYKEYERGIATWLNAYVGPRVQGYLGSLAAQLPEVPIRVMQSHGGTLTASNAGEIAVNMLLSGPAGGLAGAQFVARADHRTQLLTFDMGGTSTDVALIDGAVRLTTEGRIADYPVAVPMVDIHTIGAGGGSIARVHDGVLHVGPESAGAMPGPACYNRGGNEATVTDANLVLGRLPVGLPLGGTLELESDRAHHAVATIAAALNLSVVDTANGIIRLANEHMAQALRVISVQRGVDPRRYTLVSFGGAGGLHVCALADALGMREAMVPRYAGVLSALGMIVAPRARTLSRTVATVLVDANESRVTTAYAELADHGKRALREEGCPAEQIRIERSADLRYHGQSFSLTLPWSDSRHIAEEFAAAHEQRYGHRLPRPIELVTLRVTVSAPASSVNIPKLDERPAALPIATACDTIDNTPLPVFRRDDLAPNQAIDGPALIAEDIATTYVAREWSCIVSPVGNLLLTRQK